jgi:hypothetical protein
MKKLIYLIIGSLIMGQSFAGERVSEGLNLFCSSGGFLYNYLDIKEDGGKVEFVASGYPWGIKIDKEKLDIDLNTSIIEVNFSMDTDDCQIFMRGGNEKLPVTCTVDSLIIRFRNELNDSYIVKNLESVGISTDGFDLIIKEGGSPVITQRLGSCADLTGLD